jgi:NADH-quinone oxidoreductase subunit A
MLNQYKPIIFFTIFALLIALIPLAINKYLAPYNPSTNKLKSYECGFNSFSDARFQFDIRFYLIAILFIIFDLEMVFLFPWAILLRRGLPLESFSPMFFFLAILLAGLFYEWKKGALEWE